HRQRPQPALVEVVQQQQRRDGAENVGRVQQDHAAEDQRPEAGGPYAVGVPQPVLQRRGGEGGGGGPHQGGGRGGGGGGGGGGRERAAEGVGGVDERGHEAARCPPRRSRTPPPGERACRRGPAGVADAGDPVHGDGERPGRPRSQVRRVGQQPPGGDGRV